jgi:ubiquinone/menaquinone biosynthesis C-methylase UbiE
LPVADQSLFNHVKGNCHFPYDEDICPMKMSKLEKKFVNSEKHARGNIRVVEQIFNKAKIGHVSFALEVGCGAGHLAAHLYEKYNVRITGTDIDPKQIYLANTHSGDRENLRFFVADATCLPFKADAFDMVLSFKVMHHIGGWRAAFVEIQRVLNPNGVFILNDIACSPLITRILRFTVKKYGVYSFEEVIESGQHVGLKLIYQEGPRGFIFEPFTIVMQND